MGGRKPSLKKRITNARKRIAGDKSSRRNRLSNGQVLPIHRRLIVYPKTTSSDWLQRLSWFGGIAFKLFTLLVGIDSEFMASTKTSATGSNILFGPGDFAAVSPVANRLFTSTDKEVQALRVLPYERGSQISGTVRIVTSVDVGMRSGMHAAAIVPIDSLSELLASSVDWPDSRTKIHNQYNSVL